MASAFVVSVALTLGAGFLVALGFRGFGAIYRLGTAIVLLWVLSYFLFG